MHDLISRQAAMDAIMGQPPEPHYPSWYAEQIKALPSAQPEQRSFSCCQENDLISRRAAIDKLDPIFESLAIDKIKALPSAQPATSCSEFPNTSDVVSRKAIRKMVSAWAYDLMEQEDLNMALHDVDELPSVSAERQRGKENE
jgi:hypothetical protein